MRAIHHQQSRLIDVVRSLDEEIARLRLARDLLIQSRNALQPARRGPGRPRKMPVPFELPVAAARNGRGK